MHWLDNVPLEAQNHIPKCCSVLCLRSRCRVWGCNQGPKKIYTCCRIVLRTICYCAQWHCFKKKLLLFVLCYCSRDCATVLELILFEWMLHYLCRLRKCLEVFILLLTLTTKDFCQKEIMPTLGLLGIPVGIDIVANSPKLPGTFTNS